MLAIALVGLSTGLVAPTVASAGAAAATDRIDVAEVSEVRMINRFRRARGLAPLRIDRSLTRAAAWQARDMGRSSRFDHVDSLGRDPFVRLRAFGYPSAGTWRGENLAAGNADPGATWQQWLHSPPHRANWLVPEFRAIGVARVRVQGSPYEWYWATTFGSRWISPAR